MRLDDRPAEPTHVGSPREQLHTHVLRVPDYLHFDVRTEKDAVAVVLKAIVRNRLVPQLTGSDLSVLLALLAQASGRHFGKSGELFAFPGEARLIDQTGLSATSVYRGLAKLEELGIVLPGEATIQPKNGPSRAHRGYFLQSPDEEDEHVQRRQTVRAARGMLGKTARNTGGARNPEAARNTGGKSAQHRCGAQDTNTLNTRADLSIHEGSIHDTSISSSSANVPPEPQPVAGAAAAALREFGIGEADIGELVELPTTSREWVEAWIVESKNPGVKDPLGFVRGKLRKGERPPEKVLRQARAKLARQQLRTAEIPALPADRQKAIEEIRQLARQHAGPRTASQAQSPHPPDRQST